MKYKSFNVLHKLKCTSFGRISWSWIMAVSSKLTISRLEISQLCTNDNKKILQLEKNQKLQQTDLVSILVQNAAHLGFDVRYGLLRLVQYLFTNNIDNWNGIILNSKRCLILQLILLVCESTKIVLVPSLTRQCCWYPLIIQSNLLLAVWASKYEMSWKKNMCDAN